MSMDDSAVERFRRRTQGTSIVVLRRNLAAGAYGPTGSKARAVAEVVVEERTALELPEDQRAAARRADRTEALSVRAAWIAVAALFIAALALIVALGSP